MLLKRHRALGQIWTDKGSIWDRLETGLKVAQQQVASGLKNAVSPSAIPAPVSIHTANSARGWLQSWSRACWPRQAAFLTVLPLSVTTFQLSASALIQIGLP